MAAQLSNTELSAITVLLANVGRIAKESTYAKNYVRRCGLLLQSIMKKEAPLMGEFLMEVQGMQSFIEEEMPDDPAMCIERLRQTNSIMARSGRMLAQAKTLRDMTQREILHQMEDLATMPATTVKKTLDLETAELNEVVEALDRINKGCVHQIDSLRSLISFAKEDIRLQRTGY